MKAAFRRLMKQEHREKIDELFEDFHNGMEAFTSPPSLMPVLLSLFSYIIFFRGCDWIAQAIGLPINILYLSFCVSVVNIVSLLTFLGMGTREAALILLFGLIGIGKDQAMAYSLSLLFVGVILFSLLGLICFLAQAHPNGEAFPGRSKKPAKAAGPKKEARDPRPEIKAQKPPLKGKGFPPHRHCWVRGPVL